MKSLYDKTLFTKRRMISRFKNMKRKLQEEGYDTAEYDKALKQYKEGSNGNNNK